MNALIIYGILAIVFGICVLAQSEPRSKPLKRDSLTAKWGYPVEPDSAIGGGWFVEVDGRRIAELTEPRGQPDTPFWLSYVIVPATDDPKEKAQLLTLEFWHSGRATFRSRKFGVLATGVLISGVPPCPETHRIIARGFHVHLDPGPSLVERFIGLFRH